MAEVIGLVASVIQVAGTGLKLSQTLYQYADGVATADRRIKDIAKEIELTSFIVDELGGIFKQDETASLISENAMRTANETMQECSAVFAEIEVTLKKSRQGKIGRLMLPFRDNKIELLRSHIDKLKSTLQLLMQVLIHAYQVSSKKLDREAEAKQREEIKQLLENKKKSTKRYDESLKNSSISDASTAVDDDQDSTEEDERSISTPPPAVAASAISSSINTEALATCVDHVRILLNNIETLQQALENKVEGDDHSDHHQRLVGSYFQARDHLDSILLGNSKTPHLPNTQPHRQTLNTETEVKISIQEVLPNSAPSTASVEAAAAEPAQHTQPKRYTSALAPTRKETIEATKNQQIAKDKQPHQPHPRIISNLTQSTTPRPASSSEIAYQIPQAQSDGREFYFNILPRRIATPYARGPIAEYEEDEVTAAIKRTWGVGGDMHRYDGRCEGDESLDWDALTEHSHLEFGGEIGQEENKKKKKQSSTIKLDCEGGYKEMKRGGGKMNEVDELLREWTNVLG